MGQGGQALREGLVQAPVTASSWSMDGLWWLDRNSGRCVKKGGLPYGALKWSSSGPWRW